MLEQTKNVLQQLKFYGILGAFDIRLSEATSQGWGHGEFLSALVADEKLYRDNQRTARLVKAARFRTDASFERLDLTAKRNISRPQIQDLMELKFLQDPRNIIVIGPTGVGKTYLATAIGNHACRMGRTCVFVGINMLIERLTLARADGTYLRYRDKLVRADLLILDDLGIKKLPPETIQDLYDILEERYQNKSTVITSQLPLENWKEVIDDPVAFEAIMDRLVNSSIKLILKGESYRKKRGSKQALTTDSVPGEIKS